MGFRRAYVQQLIELCASMLSGESVDHYKQKCTVTTEVMVAGIEFQVPFSATCSDGKP